MFERFTIDARDVVVNGREQARRFDDRHIGTEHLFLALLDAGGPTADVLERQFGVTTNTFEQARSDPISDGPIDSDRDALASLGINLDEVRHMVDSTFGTGALNRARELRTKGPLRRRMRLFTCTATLAYPDQIPFAPRSKKALELSLREALRLNHKTIGAEHIALGVLAEGEGLACQILVRAGVSLAALKKSLEASLHQAA